MSIIVRAVFPQGWMGDKYDKDEKMPANEDQARRLTQSGQAYYDFEEEEPESLAPLPSDHLLSDHFDSIEDVKHATEEELLAIDGIGPKTLQEIIEYFDGE